MQRSTKVNDTLCLLKTQRAMNRVCCAIIEQSIGGELGAAFVQSPLHDRFDQSPRHAVAPYAGDDVEAFEKSHRRTARAVDVVYALRCLDEAQNSSVGRHRETNVVAARDGVRHS